MNKGKRKFKRNVISLETKHIILRRIAEGAGPTAIAKEFGLGESTIRGIRKRAVEINASTNYATNESAKGASYSRNVLIEKTEKAIFLWIEELSEKRVPIKGKLIKEKAILLYNPLKDLEPPCSSHTETPKFSASNSWLAGFLQLHNLKISGESNETPPKIFVGGYSDPEKTELFRKKIPNQTFIIKSEKKDTVRDYELINCEPNDEEKQDGLTAYNIYTGLQLCNKLETHFLSIDKNYERKAKFQREPQSCISAYSELCKSSVFYSTRRTSGYLTFVYMLIGSETEVDCIFLKRPYLYPPKMNF